MDEELPDGCVIRISAPDMVMLSSGGPLMKVECVEGDQALCSWLAYETHYGDDGSITYQDEPIEQRKLFPIICLRKLVPYYPTPSPDDGNY